MKMTKICGGIAVAVSLFAMTQTASAGCLDPADGFDINRANLAGEIKGVAYDLRCPGYPVQGVEGNWTGEPIWAYKKDGDGCIIHDRLATQLFDDSVSQKGRPTRGAANDLEDGKDESAYNHLQNFMDTAMSTRLTSADMEGDRDGFVADAYALQQCISLLTD